MDLKQSVSTAVGGDKVPKSSVFQEACVCHPTKDSYARPTVIVVCTATQGVCFGLLQTLDRTFNPNQMLEVSRVLKSVMCSGSAVCKQVSPACVALAEEMDLVVMNNMGRVGCNQLAIHQTLPNLRVIKDHVLRDSCAHAVVTRVCGSCRGSRFCCDGQFGQS